ncbi:hypothetical protein IHQ71_25170 [Rhizobium sp. TH2]|uniref:hypothetical protein n=1 Tax=Rhizobium sp. TH2 TaxID=2775403 RepID=UPI0021583ABA|nr:hypothetical protein [Rhizobium sp. TH2]UVC08401.1 hypothetical protein IHQ71_25170 [Rhizobium sp. TH2]
MLRITLAILISIVATAVNGAPDPGSRQWINERVSLWSKVCLGSLPDFNQAGSKARSLGFKPGGNGNLIYKNTEVVLSFPGKTRKCSCYMTFGTTKPKAATDLMLTKLLALGGKFEATPSPRTIGQIRTADGPMTVVVLTSKIKGRDWVATTIQGRHPCPNN